MRCSVCGAEGIRARGRCAACYERRRRREHDEERQVRAAQKALERKQERDALRSMRQTLLVAPPLAEIRRGCHISSTGCWLWDGPRLPRGYGWTRYRGTTYLVHRLAYVASGGELVSGLEIDHLCHQPSCCNPDHLEQVSHAENMARARAWVTSS